MRHVERTHRVVVLALDGVYPFELGIPSRILGAADGRYEILTCSVDGQPVRSNADFTIGVEHGPEILATADTVVITPVSSDRMPAELPEQVRAALALVRPEARIVSICTGAFVLAAAGLVTQFGLQALINIMVNVQLAPSKGMTLPFISYGGSSMLALSIGMGLLLAFTRRNPYLTRSPYVVKWSGESLTT